MSTQTLNTNYNVLDQASKIVNGLSDTSTPKAPTVVKQANEIVGETIKKTGKEVYNQTLKGIDKSFLDLLYGTTTLSDEEKKSKKLQDDIQKTALINEQRKKLAQMTGKPMVEEVKNPNSQKERVKIEKEYREMKQEHHAEQNVTRGNQQNSLETEQRKKRQEDQQKMREEQEKKAQKEQRLQDTIEVEGKQTGAPFKRKTGRKHLAPPKTSERKAGQGIGG